MQKGLGLTAGLIGGMLLSAGAIAQTAVTTSGGTTGTVPVYTGSATLGNSAITQSSSGYVGVGTTTPNAIFTVESPGVNQFASTVINSVGSQIFGVWDQPSGAATLELRDGSSNPQVTFNAFGNSWINGGNVGIGTTTPRSALDVNAFPGVNEGLRLGSYWEFGTMAAGNSAYFGINAVLTTSNIASGANAFSPIYAGGQGMVMAQNGGGSGDLIFYGTNWNSNSTQQSFPSAFTPVMSLLYSGNVGIGTTSPGQALEVTGNILLTQNKGGQITYQDGTIQSTAWNGTLTGGDYAESVDVGGDRKQYEPGDVLVIDPVDEGKFLKSSQPYSTAVMGIYSTKPGLVGRRQKTDRSHMKDEVPMAMVCVVPTKVCAEGGPIKAGDLLVTSSTPGYAMKGTDRSQLAGAIIGKALGHLDEGTGVIEVAVSIQ